MWLCFYIVLLGTYTRCGQFSGIKVQFKAVKPEPGYGECLFWSVYICAHICVHTNMHTTKLLSNSWYTTVMALLTHYTQPYTNKLHHTYIDITVQYSNRTSSSLHHIQLPCYYKSSFYALKIRIVCILNQISSIIKQVHKKFGIFN